MSASAPDPVALWTAYNDAANAGDMQAAAAFVSPDLKVMVNGVAAVGSAEQDKRAQDELLRRYPDYHRELIKGIGDGDKAAIRWRMLGTPAPELAGTVPALSVEGSSFVTIVDGVMAFAHLYYGGAMLDEVLAFSAGE
jgi:hypothetical protein